MTNLPGGNVKVLKIDIRRERERENLSRVKIIKRNLLAALIYHYPNKELN